MINAVIIEDEQPIIDGLKEMIKLFCPTVSIVGAAKTVTTAYALIQEVAPQLVFLDIQLENGSGFDLLDKLPNPTFQIIFITGFNNFAIKAFKYSAADYLLKPIDPQELQDSIQRLAPTNSPDNLSLQTLHKNSEQLENLLLKTQERYYLTKIEEIIYCKSEGNYTTFYLKGNQEIVVSKSIKYYTELFKDQPIYRVHQSFLINMKGVKQYDKKGYVHLTEGHIVPIAARRTDYFLGLLSDYTGFV